MNRRFPLILLIAAVAWPSPAAAQDGVVIDPDSPSGKEYQIPLESVRRQANPKAGKGKVVPGTRDSPLFGEGIKSKDDDSSGAAAGRGGKGPSGGSGSSGAPSPSESTASASPDVQEAVRTARSRPGDPGGGIGTAVLVGGGAAILLLAGGGAGFAMRRGGRTGAAA